MTGYKACKERKVKCDEKRPVCGKCSVHFSNLTACEYGQPVHRTAAKKPQVHAGGLNLKPVGGYPATCSRPEVRLSTLEIAQEVAALYSTVSSSQILSTTEVTKSSEDSPNETVSLGRRCGCPCHKSEFTEMMLDNVFGVCRISGIMPSLTASPGTCLPVIPETVLISGRIDPFDVLPSKQSPRDHALIYHWVNTLSLFPTLIHSQYCTNQSWLSAAMANPPLFNATLYVASAHLNSLHGQRETSESLFYKLETVRVLNEALKDPVLAISDETIAAVLLLGNIASIIGEPGEVDAHLAGLQKMVDLRGGIKSFTMHGVFLHMLCMTNHLSAVLSENQILVPSTGIAYQPLSSRSTSPSTSPSSSYTTSSASNSSVEESPLFKAFAIECGFNSILVDVFHDIGYLYTVIDAFTARLLPSFRKGFEDLVVEVKESSVISGCVDKEAILQNPLQPSYGIV